MFKQYIAQVLLNAKAMANALLKKGYTLVSGTKATVFQRWFCFFVVVQNTYECTYTVWYWLFVYPSLMVSVVMSAAPTESVTVI